MNQDVNQKQKPVYLDYNATAPLREEVAEFLIAKMRDVGNPSSIHGFGRSVRRDVEKAREQIAKLFNCETTHVTFTSGATEANNNVLFGAPVTRILYSAIEHPSVLDTAKEIKNSFAIPVLENGIVDLDVLEKMLLESSEKTLVSVMWVNNETGVIQPVEQISALAKKYDALFHCDAVQAAGRIEIDLGKIHVDYLTLSAHKIGGPSGIGALVFNHNATLKKFIHGGGQERRRRAGTENILGILGFGIAAELAQNEMGKIHELTSWRDALERDMQQAVPQVIFVGRESPRVGNTIQLILPGAAAEKQLMALDLAGVAVSSGSACSSGSVKPSHVLVAMGVSADQAACALRVSMGHSTSREELERFLAAWVTNSQRLLNT